MIIDFHSHILPGIDDGSRDIEESIILLDKLAANGTDLVVATPHFYCDEQSVDDFLANRNNAYEQLKPHLKPEHPKILLGAEVLYNQMLVSNEILYNLKIQGTDYVLLEMPYSDLDKKIIDNVANMVHFMDLKIIVAHIERYLHFTSFKNLTKLMDLDLLGQINANSLTTKNKRNCIKLMKRGNVQAIGTDIHRKDRDVAFVKDVFPIINKKLGSGYAESIMNSSAAVLSNEPVEHFF